VGGGNARRGLPIRILDFWGFVFLIFFCLLFATTLMCLLSLSLLLCDDDGFVLSLFLGSFFFLFSLSFTNYGIPFLCPNDLPVQISGHLIPILNFFRSFACSFLSVLDCSYHISLNIFVLVFRCFFSVNYSYSNSFRTENRWLARL